MSSKLRDPNPRTAFIPGAVDLGHGFVVKVVLVPQLRGCDGEWCGIDHSKDPMTIRINASAPLWRQHEVFAHELVHATLDFFQWLRDTLVDTMKDEAAETAAALKEVEQP